MLYKAKNGSNFGGAHNNLEALYKELESIRDQKQSELEQANERIRQRYFIRETSILASIRQLQE